VATDLYAILGVVRGATAEEIKRAYRQRARQYHPDANPDPAAAERIKEINGAYEILSDPAKRERYDLYGDPSQAPSFAGFGDLGDLMESFFGQAFGGRTRTRTRAAGPVRGNDLSLRIELEFAEAVFGVSKQVTVEILRACDRCGGSACEPGTFRSRCATCGGSGEQRSVQRSVFGTVMSSRPCAGCGGVGEVPAVPCRDCGGAGRVRREDPIDIAVPAGIAEGQTIHIDGVGEAGFLGGPPGDLYVQVLVRPHPVFARDRDDLLCALTIPLTAAALGGEVPVETLDGEERIRVAAGTQPGTLVRIRGKGVPRLGGRGRGDLIVQLMVEIPTKLKGEERVLIEKLAALRGEETGEVKGILDRFRDAFRR
jgi:molecular chaperone DnaJ